MRPSKCKILGLQNWLAYFNQKHIWKGDIEPENDLLEAYLEQQTYVGLVTYMSASINSLGSSDTILPYRSWSTLVQVMACFLTTPSHYLNQYWLNIRGSICHSPEGNFTMLKVSFLDMSLKITISRLSQYLPGASELTPLGDLNVILKM